MVNRPTCFGQVTHVYNANVLLSPMGADKKVVTRQIFGDLQVKSL